MNSPIQPIEASESVEVSAKKALRDNRPIFLAMQGGGAKGVAHVGALSAIEEFGYDIQGVSGTSAGSMVAALVAAGFKANELVNVEAKHHLFSHRANALGFHQPTDIFPGSGWRRLKIIQVVAPVALFVLGFGKRASKAKAQVKLSAEELDRSNERKLNENHRDRRELEHELSSASFIKCAKRRPEPTNWRQWLVTCCIKRSSEAKTLLYWLVRLKANLLWFGVLSFLPFTAIALGIQWGIKEFPTVTVVGLSAFILLTFLGVRQLKRSALQAVNGLNTVGNVSLLIDRLIGDKLGKAGYSKTSGITFADLKKARLQAGTIPLKIVATNVAYECLELFCEDRTPDVKVGDAVAASVCLPIVFEPWNLTFFRHTETRTELIQGQFLDGGLVSNLPAWPFDEERVLNPGIGTIALSLESEVKIGQHWAGAVVGTVVNGSSMIHTRAAGSTLKISLTPELTMMQFDASAEDVRNVVSAAKLAVGARLGLETRARIALQSAATALHKQIDNMMQLGMGSWFLNANKHRMRVAIVAERGGSMNSLSTVFTHGYKSTDVDRTITRRADCWIFEKALHTKKPQLFILQKRAPGDDQYNGERVWPRARWLACFPVPMSETSSEMHGKRQRRCVVVVDSNSEFDINAPGIKGFMELFLTHCHAGVRNYFESRSLMAAVQGENTWI